MTTENNTKTNSASGFVVSQEHSNIPDTNHNNSFNECSDRPANYEEAIKAAQFGKYNIMIILTLIPPAFATTFSTAVMSYVFPIAQCDLNLSLTNKGLLNSITYFGMLSSGFLWGFLTDTLGRKKLMIYVFLLDGFFVTLCAVSQSFIYLTVVKFFEGFIVNGGYAAVLSYTNEFHSSSQRRIIPLINGTFINSGGVILPLLSWIIFTDSFSFSVFSNFIVLRSWNVFLLFTAIPSFIAGFMYILLPESPKFLMTVGKNEQALETFSKIYKCNTGNPKFKYPIKSLIDEPKLHENDKHGGHVTSNRSNIQALKEGFQQITPLFYPPHCMNMIIILTTQFGFLMGLNTLRLWLPQLFIAINDYETLQKQEKYDLCATLEMLAYSSKAQNETCFVNYDNDVVYLHNAICSLVAMGTLICTIPLLRKFGKKITLSTAGILSGLCVILVYFGNNIAITVTLFSFFIGFTHVAANTLLGSVVDLFPTTLRALALSLTMVAGRLGSSVGNVVFPSLLSAGCIYPFVLMGSIITGCAIVAMMLPNSDKKALQ